MNQTNTRRNKFIVFLVIFVGIALVQFTELRYIWGIKDISMFYNICFILILSLYIVFNICVQRFSNNVWVYYILPGLLVFIGYFANITINVLRDQSLAIYFGSLIPWLTYLSVPFLLKDNIINTKNLLRYYYYLTLLITTFGIFEYFLYFNGFINLQVLNHPNGVFLSGWFSILHMLENGVGHYRFYASIGEAGNLAMILIPSLIYSIVYKRYLGGSILSLGIYLTDSLGALISITIGVFLLLILLYRKYKYSIFTLILSIVLILSVIVINLGNIYYMYEHKYDSRKVREAQIVNTISNLPSMLVNNPLGFDFSTNYSENTNKHYYGANFMPLNSFYGGGLSALIGYLIIITVFFFTSLSCFYRKKISREDIIFSVSIIVLLPFIVQRSAILETSMLILVLSPFVIKSLGIYSKNI